MCSASFALHPWLQRPPWDAAGAALGSAAWGSLTVLSAGAHTMQLLPRHLGSEGPDSALPTSHTQIEACPWLPVGLPRRCVLGVAVPRPPALPPAGEPRGIQTSLPGSAALGTAPGVGCPAALV